MMSATNEMETLMRPRGNGGMICSQMQWLAREDFLKTLSRLFLLSQVAAHGALTGRQRPAPRIMWVTLPSHMSLGLT